MTHKSDNISTQGMKEEDVFRRAQEDPQFRAVILAEWMRSKTKARIFLGVAIAMFSISVLYTGIRFGHWVPNFFWAGLVIVALWIQSTASTTIAALRAMSQESPNKSPETNALPGQ